MAKKIKVEDIPEGYNYAAIDADGFAFAYKSQPYFDKKNEVWKSPLPEDSIRMIGGGFDTTDWQNSLVSREAAEQAELKKLTGTDIPDGYEYAAVDSTGVAFGFKQKPNICDEYNCWRCDDQKPMYLIGRGFDSQDWQNSLVSREPEQKPKLKKLTAADIAEGYNYAAVDSDGQAYGYLERPERGNAIWVMVVGGGFTFLGKDFDATDWQNSLVSREPEQKPKLKKLTAADIAEGYNYAAVDQNGSQYAFVRKPDLFGRVWGCDTRYNFLGRFDNSDWQNSLVSRESKHFEPAYKETTNKLSYSEIDPYFLEAMARRMNEGKRKYGPNNWKKLSNINELLDAAQRHLLELRKMMEEDFEPLPGEETDLQHCAALACNAMFIHYHLNPNT